MYHCTCAENQKNSSTRTTYYKFPEFLVWILTFYYTVDTIIMCAQLQYTLIKGHFFSIFSGKSAQFGQRQTTMDGNRSSIQCNGGTFHYNFCTLKTMVIADSLFTKNDAFLIPFPKSSLLITYLTYLIKQGISTFAN